MISLDNLDSWIREQEDDSDLYSSKFRYSTEDPYIGGVLAGLGFDLDCVEKPEKARKEAISLIADLKNRFNIPEKSISIHFSGNKGFHVFINRRVFDLEPDTDLPAVFKKMAEELQNNLNLKTVDTKVYERRRLWRIPNSKHSKTGLYKIPLSFIELKTLNIDKIKSSAVNPRQSPKTPREEHVISNKARAWYLQHQSKVKEWISERKKDFKSLEIIQITEDPPCIKKRWEVGAPEGCRNLYTWQMATWLKEKSVSKEEVLSSLLKWREVFEEGKYGFSNREVENTVKAVYERDYKIGCGSEFIRDLCPGKVQCPFFRPKLEQETFSDQELQKAHEILETKDPFEFIVNVTSKIHAGDEYAIIIEYISALSSKLTETKINTWQLGSSGKGKSHLKNTVLKLLPRDMYEVFTSASPKSLFYYVKEYGEDALSNKLLYIDEVEASKDALPILRSLTGQTEITPRHLSVYDADLLDLKIKGQRAVWFTSVKTFGTEQISNRFIHLNPDETLEQDELVLRLQDKRYREGIRVSEEIFQAARCVTKTIIDETEDLDVKIPFRIKWVYKNRRWLYPIFLAFIKTIAKARYKYRETDSESRIIAQPEDFQLAKQLWKSFEKTIIYRVSDAAMKVLTELSDDPERGLTHAELSELLPYSTKWIGKKCQELQDAQLINAQKRRKEGRGRNEWEYWRAPTQSIEDMELIPGEVIKELRKSVSGS
jgi:hypothetical protein